MSAFFAAVYEVVARIPAGRVATYGQVAWLAGRPRAARAVGTALRQAPAGLPCHRVLNGQGKLAPEGTFSSPGEQARLLRAEGIQVSRERRVDLRRYGWQGEQGSQHGLPAPPPGEDDR